MIGNRKYVAGRRQSTRTPIIIALLSLLIVIGVTVTIWQIRRQPQPVLPSIASQLQFSPFVVTHSGGSSVVSQKYDKDSQVYFFVMKTSRGDEFTVSEQASPVNFSEIPDLYTKLLDGMHKYDTVETANGTVNLVQPKPGQSEAVMNERGVLMFIHSDLANVSKSTWKQAVESLDIYNLQQISK